MNFIRPGDPFDLARFLRAQEMNYARAVAELRAGAKQSHWVWYVFPQLRGLGTSPAAHLYGLAGLDEAVAYLAHPVLGARLRECVNAMRDAPSDDAAQVLGSVDALKFRSCLTLFQVVAPAEALWTTALARYFGGQPDARTLALLAVPP